MGGLFRREDLVVEGFFLVIGGTQVNDGSNAGIIGLNLSASDNGNEGEEDDLDLVKMIRVDIGGDISWPRFCATIYKMVEISIIFMLG